jgi:hemin uptake protein HemP
VIVHDRGKTPPTPLPAARSGSLAQPRARRAITSAELFGDGREIHIMHADELYTLRQTSKGKLILTK